MANMVENTFPVYGSDAIVNFFRTEVLTDLEAKHFSKGDLLPVPKPEAVQMLYMRVLHLVYRIRPDCISMLPLSANVQVPAYHERSTAILSVYSRMCEFLPVCMVYDFSISDLLTPKKQRTLTILSAIMNFLYLRMERCEMMAEKVAHYRAAKKELQTVTQSISKAENKIELLQVIPPEQQAEADELAAALSELQTTTAHELQEVQTKTEAIAEWKSAIADTSQKLAQVKVNFSDLKEDIGKLKPQIVESPEELKSQLEKMRENIRTTKMSIEETDGSMVDLQYMVQSVAYAEAEIQHIVNMLQDLESSFNGSKQRQEEYQDLLAQYEKKQKDLKNLCVEESQQKRALAMRLDKGSKQNIRRQKKREMMEQHVQDVMGQCSQIQQKREEVAQRIQDISAETQQLKAKTHSLRDTCSKETERAQVLYDTLSRAMDVMHGRMDELVTDLQRDIQKEIK